MRCLAIPTLLSLAVAATFSAVGAPRATAALIHVEPDGTGDVPTIEDAILVAADGDTIELGTGTFVGDGNVALTLGTESLTLRSQDGVASTCIIDCADIWFALEVEGPAGPEITVEGITFTNGRRIASAEGGAVSLSGGVGAVFRGCVFAKNETRGGMGGAVSSRESPVTFEECAFADNWAGYDGVGGALGLSHASATLEGCTFSQNRGVEGSAIWLEWSSPTIEHTIFFGGSSDPVHCGVNGFPQFFCCNSFGNAGGDPGACVGSGIETFSADPLFCDPVGGDFRLAANSPCLPGETPCGVLVGAQGEGCPPLPVGACCFADGTCLLAGYPFCASREGTFEGVGSSCATVTCEGYGPCCIADSICQFVPEPECTAWGGEFQGAGIACQDGICSPIVVRPDGSGEYPTIQDAIDAAPNNGQIVLADGVYAGSGNVSLEIAYKVVTLRSMSGNADQCILDCGSMSRGLDLRQGTAGTLVQDLTIANTRFSGIRVYNGGGVRMSRVILRDGLGLSVFSGSSAELEECVLEGNSATTAGGNASVTESSIRLTGCTIRDGDAGDEGGGVFLSNAVATIEECRFESNHATIGGGIRAVSSQTTIQRSLFSGNHAGIDGGAVQLAGGIATLDGCTLAHNSANLGGAGLSVTDAGITVVNTLIALNQDGFETVYCGPGGSVDLACSDVFGNEGGDFVGCLAGQDGSDGNFSADPFFCGPDDGDYRLAADSPCAPENSPCGELVGALGVGCIGTTSVGEAALAPGLALEGPFPNPTRGAVSIRATLAAGGEVELVVIDVAGAEVARTRQVVPAGSATFHWTPDGAAKWPSGVYYLRARAGEARTTRKFLVVH